MFGINNKTEEYNVEFKNGNETEIEGINEGKKIDKCKLWQTCRLQYNFSICYVDFCLYLSK
jgi:hypothetical protein